MLIPKITLTKEDILNKISQEEIFSKYSEFKEIGKHFLSPFKSERTPSCIVFPGNEYLNFKCFATGKFGNCFTLVMETLGVDYKEALLIIKNDFNIQTDFNKSNSTKFYLPKVTNIQIKSIDWTTKHLNYWSQYGISKETLIRFNIKPINYYWINYNRFKVDFGFAYCFENKFKILQPEELDWKWISNCNNIVQGYYQLFPHNEIIITSSLKDVACIYENLHIPAIAPGSENTYLPDWIIPILRKNFKKITIWFNNDLAGILAANNYKNKYPDFNIFIHNKELGEKDPSDLVKAGYDLKLIYYDN